MEALGQYARSGNAATHLTVHHAAGFSLLEVLIALIVLSTAMLGLAAMQSTSYRFTYQARLHSQSVLRVADLVARMRANVVGAQHYVQTSIPQSYPRDCGAGVCTAAQLAIYDLVRWQRRNTELLPEANGQVTGAAQLSEYTVTVTWRAVAVGVGQREFAATSAACQPPEPNLRCYARRVRL